MDQRLFGQYNHHITGNCDAGCGFITVTGDILYSINMLLCNNEIDMLLN
jgi:hypothetical protein